MNMPVQPQHPGRAAYIWAQALGNPLPEFAHVPYVAAPGSKEKLSKRKIEQYRRNPQFQKMFEKADEVFPQLGLVGSAALDPVMGEYYERIGYLPAAVLNALGRIGWSLDDSTEIMSLLGMQSPFSRRSGARLPDQTFPGSGRRQS